MTLITLNSDDVREAVSMADAIRAVEGALRDLADDKFEQPVRTVMGGGQYLVMSILHRPTSTAMVKALSLSFDRVPAIAGTVTYIDLESARSLIAEAGAITAIRTGAISGLATRVLARQDAHRMAIIGAGGQAADQVRAIQAVRPLSRLNLANLSSPRSHALAEQLAAEFPNTEVVVCASVEEAVADVDVITCATNAENPVLRAEMLPERVHINAIGAFRPTMRELPDDVMRRASVFIDDKSAILEESGEILHAIDQGAITESDLTELGRALESKPELRPWTVFKTVGVAAQDWALGSLLLEHSAASSRAFT